MSTALITAAGAIIAALLTGIFGLLLARMLRPNELIDQLQEERGETAKRLTAAEKKIDTLAYRQRYYEDYVNELRAHIEAGSPPPPPPYPAGLLRIDMT